MNVEKELLAIIPKLLKAYDADKRGTNFDVGVGTFNFYCELFAKLGYSTIAIEPLPSQAVKSFIGNPKITLVEGCLLDKNGTVEIYSGVYNDTECTDVSSVNKDWWGITDKSQKKIVSSFTLQTLITQQNIKEISYFKIDTEGSEEPIILQFTSLHQTLLPKVIEFEYGGGSAKKEGKDGWANKYFTGTIQSIHTLKNLGYNYLLLFEKENQYPKEYLLSELEKAEWIFEDHFTYGNILMFMERKFILRNNVIRFSNQNTIIDKIKNMF